MICPYCGTGVNFEWTVYDLYPEWESNNEDEELFIHKLSYAFCPECAEMVVKYQSGTAENDEDKYPIKKEKVNKTILPMIPSTRVLDQSVPEKFMDEFKEAEITLHVSPKASATLCRRLLQQVLRSEGISPKDLADEIEEFAQKRNPPAELINLLTILRKVANFGAHPSKSKQPNEIVEIEAGEADLLLEIMLQLFDFLHVRPAKLREFRKTIQTKYKIPMDI